MSQRLSDSMLKGEMSGVLRSDDSDGTIYMIIASFKNELPFRRKTFFRRVILRQTLHYSKVFFIPFFNDRLFHFSACILDQ